MGREMQTRCQSRNLRFIEVSVLKKTPDVKAIYGVCAGSMMDCSAGSRAGISRADAFRDTIRAPMLPHGPASYKGAVLISRAPAI